ncbi:pyrroloquinoline quinone biosynthesis protein PqqF [Cystobacter ferrugineus]|uniref:Coenzyme PQQ synthesis protein F n=1 Tax=Cystobacter ferrugineus TaxID=83449 RepID=A0A1L9B4Z6_9BACT|nr:pyrroloquinoline quinone biosynthesis protein PqqF [Cystobacter ferrugineus]OJH37293.1 coenzyme PQQ biosynthesis protein PqqF [Cystobacter ferrugineus]
MTESIDQGRESLVLAHGLRVRLRHEPRLRRAAAWLRVEAGSHDVDARWPGLAHFLEHLVFLGTERFPREQGLMAFVQRHGGQVNARTSERTTDYFFELPQAVFGEGLERLCDMLARPRLAIEDQQREREVLHAEFIAWSRDTQAQHLFGLAGGVSARHPLRAFHAGNRDSLPVASPEFQQALHDFHQRYYRTGQMTLQLVGPQPPRILAGLARDADAALAAGPRSANAPVETLLGDPGEAPPASDPQRLNLLFACDGLPPGTDEALRFLELWAGSAHPGGLLAELRRLGWAQSLSLSPLYQYADQALVNFEVQLTEAGRQSRAAAQALCFDWLKYFQSHAGWEPLREEYRLLRGRQSRTEGALELARRLAHGQLPELPDESVPALRALLERFTPQALLAPGAQALDEPPRLPPFGPWRLPPRNRFLRGQRQPTQASPRIAALAHGEPEPNRGLEGAVHLRWRLANRHHAALWHMLDASLRRLGEEARQAGVQLEFSRLGPDWQLRLCGVREPLPAILEQAVELLQRPAPESWRQASPPPRQQVPIRELLAQWPEHGLGHYRPARNDSSELHPEALQRLWQQARWDGLVLDFDDADRLALDAVAARLPGSASNDLLQPSTLPDRASWSQVACGSDEHALLVWCPAPSVSIEDEAAWRALAQLLQAPFYQRLRTELQLGYAVFSAFRQLAGRPGLLFGVQSPGSDCAALWGHIAEFLNALPERLAQWPGTRLREQCAALADSLDGGNLGLAQRLEMQWQGRLAGRSSDYSNTLRESYSNTLRESVVQLEGPALVEAAHRLLASQVRWTALATGPCPGASWYEAV